MQKLGSKAAILQALRWKHSNYKMVDHGEHLAKQLKPQDKATIKEDAESVSKSHKIISFAKSQKLMRVKSSFNGPNMHVAT